MMFICKVKNKLEKWKVTRNEQRIKDPGFRCTSGEGVKNIHFSKHKPILQVVPSVMKFNVSHFPLTTNPGLEIINETLLFFPPPRANNCTCLSPQPLCLNFHEINLWGFQESTPLPPLANPRGGNLYQEYQLYEIDRIRNKTITLFSGGIFFFRFVTRSFLRNDWNPESVVKFLILNVCIYIYKDAAVSIPALKLDLNVCGNIQKHGQGR